MRFKVSLSKEGSRNTPVTCVGWSNTEEVYSAGDDNKLLSWNISNNESTMVAEFSSDIYPICMHFLPKIGGLLAKQDLILLTSADGKFHIMNRNGRIERSVDAHKGAVLVGQWSNDGSSLLTAGEDGCVKIWSRGGMLRSTVVMGDSSVYDAHWAPDNQSIVYTQGKFLIIKNLAPNTKPTRWLAHDGLILCLAWSATSELIVSGGEDCRYRVWDNSGRPVFSSNLHDHPITSVAWSPNGEMFAIGSYNTLRLCDLLGWSHSLDKPNTGCIYKLAWSSDATQVAGACANGCILFAHVIERQNSYANCVATVSEKKTVTVENVVNETSEILELPERIIQIAMKYGHLVVTTPKQCYIYSINSWNTPNIFDLKDSSVLTLLLCEKHMLIVDRTGLSLYNYQGKLIASPRWPNMQLGQFRSSIISLSADTLVARDGLDWKIMHVIDLTSNRNMPESSTTIVHGSPVTDLALDQAGAHTQRTLAILDKNKNLYFCHVRSPNKSLLKLGSQIRSFCWNTEENMLAAIQDVQVIIWYFPSACFNTNLLRLCSVQYDSLELGRSPRINNFTDNFVEIRKADGSLTNVSISQFAALLHKHIQENSWDKALKLCRLVNDKMLWAGLAVLATQSNNNDLLDVAEEAYAAINQYDKVYYIQHIKGLPSKAQQMAGAALLAGTVQNAESILLHNGLVYQAILTNARLHNWNRALELALKHKTQIDTVLYLRQKYLDALGKEENNAKYINLHETVNVDKEKIQERLEKEGI